MTGPRRYSDEEIRELAMTALEDGFCLLPGQIPDTVVASWREEFHRLFAEYLAHGGDAENRGSSRFYMTLPFREPFADPAVFADPDILAVVERLVGADTVMCQLATDTPLRGSDYQDVHRDTLPLFPETGQETPPYQLAVNFPLVDVPAALGPIEITRGTHMMSKEAGLEALASGRVTLEPLLMRAGDVLIRDVRGLHRGTPNLTDVPRPMVVIGYSRRWLYRPEVSIRVPRAVLESLGERERFLLRFNPVVDGPAQEPGSEVYRQFAY